MKSPHAFHGLHRNRKLADLVELYYALLYRYAYRLTGSEADAEDLTQQVFLTAQAKWDQLRDETKAKSWLFTIARNAYLKELRGPVCIPSSALDELPGKSDWKSHGAAAESGPFDFDQEQLQKVLNDLPEEFRSPIVLFYFEEFSYKEIAEQMDVPVGTIMSRLARAKACLRQRLSAPESGVPPERRKLRFDERRFDSRFNVDNRFNFEKWIQIEDLGDSQSEGRMNCLTARETLDLIRPQEAPLYDAEGNELPLATIDEAARHVKGCPACQTAVRRRERIDERIGQLSRELPVPEGLQERLLGAAESLPPSARTLTVTETRIESSEARPRTNVANGGGLFGW